MASIRALAIYPVKDEPGDMLTAVDVETEGLAGDRRKKRPVHLVGAQITPDAARANLFCDLPEAELQALVGQDVGVGGAVLSITELPSGCPGVYADVATPGRVAVGDALRPRR